MADDGKSDISNGVVNLNYYSGWGDDDAWGAGGGTGVYCSRGPNILPHKPNVLIDQGNTCLIYFYKK